MKIKDFKDIGKRLKAAREPYTQKEIADILGLSRSYIGNIEQGRTKPSLEYLIALAEKQDVSLDWLVLGKEKTSPQEKLKSLEEASGDIDLHNMILYLRELWFSGDYDLRGWVKIQFKRAFTDFQDWLQKKHGSSGTSTQNGA